MFGATGLDELTPQPKALLPADLGLGRRGPSTGLQHHREVLILCSHTTLRAKFRIRDESHGKLATVCSLCAYGPRSVY